MANVRDDPDAARVDVDGRPIALIPLVLGFEAVAESVSVAGGSTFRHLMEPVTGAAVVFDRGWVLVDGGFDPARVHDRAVRREVFDYENYAPIVPRPDPLRRQIDAAGLSWSTLAAVVLTHAHFDHTGGVRMLRPGAPVILQRAEWEHLRGAADPRMAFHLPGDFERADLDIALVDGDTVLADGLDVIDTAGHTPGHQSVVVTLPERTIVLAGDAADLRANIEHRTPCGSSVGGDGAARAQRAIDRLADLDARAGWEVWPAHDPDWAPWRDVVAAQA